MSLVVGNCSRCESPLEKGDLRCAICGAAVRQAAPTHLDRSQTRRVVQPSDRARAGQAADGPAPEETSITFLRCSGCSAAIAYDASAAGLACAFCDAKLEIETVDDPLEQTEAWLPFRIAESRAHEALEAFWRAGGLFRARDIPQRARLQSLRPIYWVGWVFDVEALISWTADSDVGARRSPWAPHAGQVVLGFEQVLINASRGLSDVEAQALRAGYDVRTAAEQPTPPESAEPVQEQFDVQRSQARARILTAIERVARESIANGHVPGRSVRNVHAQAMLRRLRTRRLAFPAWVVAWRYEDEIYRTVVSGQDANSVHGTRPTIIAQLGAGRLFAIGLVLALIATVLFFVFAR